MAFIELKDVSFSYPGDNLAVDHVSLAIERGEKVAIIGENGAGKTTTAKLINGLLRPFNGDVFVDGTNTKDVTAARIAAKVGYVFQNPDDQIFNKDVWHEVSYSPRYFKLDDKEIERRVARALHLTGMEEFRDVNPYNLAFSTRKFVTIAAVLAMETDAIIFDEPTAGQDQAGLDQLSYMISELEKEGRSIITITHDMEFVVNNFDRTVVMADKHIIADGHNRDIFWQLDILKEAAVGQPCVSKLALELGITSEKIVRTEEFIDAIQNGKPAGEAK